MASLLAPFPNRNNGFRQRLQDTDGYHWTLRQTLPPFGAIYEDTHDGFAFVDQGDSRKFTALEDVDSDFVVEKDDTVHDHWHFTSDDDDITLTVLSVDPFDVSRRYSFDEIRSHEIVSYETKIVEGASFTVPALDLTKAVPLWDFGARRVLPPPKGRKEDAATKNLANMSTFLERVKDVTMELFLFAIDPSDTEFTERLERFRQELEELRSDELWKHDDPTTASDPYSAKAVDPLLLFPFLFTGLRKPYFDLIGAVQDTIVDGSKGTTTTTTTTDPEQTLRAQMVSHEEVCMQTILNPDWPPWQTFRRKLAEITQKFAMRYGFVAEWWSKYLFSIVEEKIFDDVRRYCTELATAREIDETMGRAEWVLQRQQTAESGKKRSYTDTSTSSGKRAR